MQYTKIARIITMTGALLTLVACTTYTVGHHVPLDNMQGIQIGRTSSSEVVSRLGTPSSTNYQGDHVVYAYHQSQLKYAPLSAIPFVNLFSMNATTTGTTLSLTFDRAGILSACSVSEQLGHVHGAPIASVAGVMPSQDNTTQVFACGTDASNAALQGGGGIPAASAPTVPTATSAPSAPGPDLSGQALTMANRDDCNAVEKPQIMDEFDDGGGKAQRYYVKCGDGSARYVTCRNGACGQ